MIYAWVKNASNNENTCVSGNPKCMVNAHGDPVLTCSLERNKNKPICTDTVYADAAYRVLGCYNTPDCGGHVPMDVQTEPPACELGDHCRDLNDPELRNRCVLLRDGITPDEKSGKEYCFLGGFQNYDPCSLSAKKGGPDFCPRSCFNARCCPGSF